MESERFDEDVRVAVNKAVSRIQNDHLPISRQNLQQVSLNLINRFIGGSPPLRRNGSGSGAMVIVVCGNAKTIRRYLGSIRLDQIISPRP